MFFLHAYVVCTVHRKSCSGFYSVYLAFSLAVNWTHFQPQRQDKKWNRYVEQTDRQTNRENKKQSTKEKTEVKNNSF